MGCEESGLGRGGRRGCAGWAIGGGGGEWARAGRLNRGKERGLLGFFAFSLISFLPTI